MDWYLICKITILPLKKLEGNEKLEGIMVIPLQSSLPPFSSAHHWADSFCWSLMDHISLLFSSPSSYPSNQTTGWSSPSNPLPPSISPSYQTQRKTILFYSKLDVASCEKNLDQSSIYYIFMCPHI